MSDSDEEGIFTATILRTKGKRPTFQFSEKEVKPESKSAGTERPDEEKKEITTAEESAITTKTTETNQSTNQPPPTKKLRPGAPLPTAKTQANNSKITENNPAVHHDFLKSKRSKLGLTKQQLTTKTQTTKTVPTTASSGGTSAAQRNAAIQQNKPSQKRASTTTVSDTRSTTTTTTTAAATKKRVTAITATTTTAKGIRAIGSRPGITGTTTAVSTRGQLATRNGAARRTIVQPQRLQQQQQQQQQLQRHRTTGTRTTSTNNNNDTGNSTMMKVLADLKDMVYEIKLQVSSNPINVAYQATHLKQGEASQQQPPPPPPPLFSAESVAADKALIESLQREKLQLLSEKGALEVTVGTLKSHQSALEMEVDQYKSVAKTRQAEIERITIEKTDAAKKASAAEQRSAELEALCKEKQDHNTELQASLSAKTELVAQMKAKLDEYEMVRRRLHNEVQELKGNIRVFCRVRPPLTTAERAEAQIFAYSAMDPGKIEVSEQTLSVRGEQQVRKYEFNYDRVFGPETTQEQVFEELSQLVQSALDGYSCCVFAYGQTGSGKTYTMEGPTTTSTSGEVTPFAAESPQRGVIPRTVEQIFAAVERLKECGWEYTIEVSFLEVYNEQLRDLLFLESTSQQQQQQQQQLQLVGGEDGLSVVGCRVVGVTAPDKVYALLDIARKNRVVAETKYNEHSSRSHSVFRLHIRGHNAKRRETVTSILNLVDLAGSERLDAGHNKAERQKETQNINKSLSNLRNVITALAENKKHVPYRESVLTRLLQNSLEKKAKMLMFVNVSPSVASVGQTLGALRFASTANKCHIGTVQRQATSDK